MVQAAPPVDATDTQAEVVAPAPKPEHKGIQIELPEDFGGFDIETEPLDDDILRALCPAFGLPGKVTEVDGVEVSGKTFYQVWRANRAAAVEYLRGDILLPVELARRMRVV
uniref:Uncharacterized protein n=1 Tax=viral metagenome TaxID=1070528 RepID=A0A6M3KVA9_9ZZZZ